MRRRHRTLSLRARLGLASGVAVALAVLAVALTAYAGTRSDLRDQIDSTLRQQAEQVAGRGGGPGRGPGSGLPGAPAATSPAAALPALPARGGSGDDSDCDQGLGLDRARSQFGPSVHYQVVTRAGSRCDYASNATLPIDAATQRIAASGGTSRLTDATVSGFHLRVLTAALPAGGAIQLAADLTNVDRTLRDQVLLLALIAAGGIALAALLGVLVARTALAPVARFTTQTETIAAHPERLGQRLDVDGDDEIARLGRTFNQTLDALESSIEAQRNLVADASHELRTPIATLRANLQLMRDEERLAAADRTALRADMIEELDELTNLVADVVELARGSKPSGQLDDVRVDAIAGEVAERTRRRAPQLTVVGALEPTLVRGDPARIGRAITNLLDNARKWSPAGGVIEVGLRDGLLTVRDHGPGFHEEDIPFVFDRFHRAKDARGKPGSGLGLAIVRQAAEAHGGFARAANAPGGGALLTVSFGPHTRPADPAEGPAGEMRVEA